MEYTDELMHFLKTATPGDTFTINDTKIVCQQYDNYCDPKCICYVKKLSGGYCGAVKHTADSVTPWWYCPCSHTKTYRRIDEVLGE